MKDLKMQKNISIHMVRLMNDHFVSLIVITVGVMLILAILAIAGHYV